MFIKEFSLYPTEQKTILHVPNGQQITGIKIEALKKDEVTWILEASHDILPQNESLSILNQSPDLKQFRVTGNFEKVN